MALTSKLAKEMSITYDSDLVLLVTDYSFTVNKEAVEVTTFDSAGWRQFLSDLKDWTISGTCNWGKGTAGANEAGYDELMAEIKSGTASVAIVFQGTDSGDFIETGTGFLTSLDGSGQLGDKGSFSFEIQGDGAIVTTQLT